MAGVIAIETERMEIHFLSDVFGPHRRGILNSLLLYLFHFLI